MARWDGKTGKGSGKGEGSKSGTPYERAVAETVAAMQPATTQVTQGQWVEGPDGVRDMDVFVEGYVDGKAVRVLIECKDYNPETTGKVGIELVDALESKARDLAVDRALICSNAGFTEGAIKKAARVGIGLVAAINKNDPRIRILVSEVAYTRQLRVRELAMTLSYQGGPLPFSDFPFEAVTYEGLSVGNWLLRNLVQVAGLNLIVNGNFTLTYKFHEPIEIEVHGEAASLDHLALQVKLSGAWFQQDVTLNGSAALYDWLRRRFRITPGGGQISYADFDPMGGELVERPPDHAFDLSIEEGESAMRFVTLRDFPLEIEEYADLSPFIEPDDLEATFPDDLVVPEEWRVSDPGFGVQDAAVGKRPHL